MSLSVVDVPVLSGFLILAGDLCTNVNGVPVLLLASHVLLARMLLLLSGAS